MIHIFFKKRSLAATRTLTTKIEVYVYGVILIEIFTGRKVIDEFFPKNDRYLVPIFRKMYLIMRNFETV
jgi:hypothetical protein